MSIVHNFTFYCGCLGRYGCARISRHSRNSSKSNSFMDHFTLSCWCFGFCRQARVIRHSVFVVQFVFLLWFKNNFKNLLIDMQPPFWICLVSTVGSGRARVIRHSVFVVQFVFLLWFKNNFKNLLIDMQPPFWICLVSTVGSGRECLMCLICPHNLLQCTDYK